MQRRKSPKGPLLEYCITEAVLGGRQVTTVYPETHASRHKSTPKNKHIPGCCFAAVARHHTRRRKNDVDSIDKTGGARVSQDSPHEELIDSPLGSRGLLYFMFFVLAKARARRTGRLVDFPNSGSRRPFSVEAGLWNSPKILKCQNLLLNFRKPKQS